MKKITTGYSELQILFNELGVRYIDDGEATDNFGKEVTLSIFEQGGKVAATFHFNVDSDGNETFDYVE